MNEQGKTKKKEILSLGDIAWDIYFLPSSEILKERTPGKIELCPGGSAANFAVWASRLKGRARLWGTVGDDPLGAMMIDHLRGEGVDFKNFSQKGDRTTRIGMLKTGQEEKRIIDRQLSPGFPFPYGPEDLTGCDLLFFTGFALSVDFLPSLKAFLNLAREQKVHIAFDPSSFHQKEEAQLILKELEPLDYILANEEEVQALFPSGLDFLLDLADMLVLKRGEKGSTVFQGKKEIPYPIEAKKAIDPIGAGDAFDAAFLLSLLQGKEITEVLYIASLLGSYVANRLGAQPMDAEFIPIREKFLKGP